MPKALDIAGKRFGRLVVLRRQVIDGARNVMWRCQCDCGEITVAAASNLAAGDTVSCGCYARELNSRLNRTHGMTNTPEFRSWKLMKDRCYLKTCRSFKNYGARGIKVCERWQESFENFFRDMGLKPSPKHSIDRINNDGDYAPDNCRWATQKQQNRNSRQTHLIEFEGEILCILDWSVKIGFVRKRIYNLMRRGYSGPEALRLLKYGGG